MRYTIFKRGGYNAGTIGTTGGEVNGSVFLSRDPIAVNEAVTKNYLDLKFSSIPTSSFVSGTLAIERLPEFSGDIVKPVGGTVTNFKSTGVSPGVYTKVTVNPKGLVTGGTTLIDTDLPDVSWNKIVGGKPTTLGGYGITNALSTSGGSMVGVLGVTSVVEDPASLINKNYVDAIGVSANSVSTGSIIHRNTTVTPTGYLKANGGVVNKTTYAALYSVVGDTFDSRMPPGSGKPWKQQYNINTTQSTDITGWTKTGDLPGIVYWSQAIVTKNRVYMLGGYNATGGYLTTYTAPINEDGTLGAWTTGGNLPSILHYAQAIVTKNCVHLIGGYVNSASNKVYTAPVNPDGTIGAWVAGTDLPVGMWASQAIVTKNRVYLIGSASSSEIYTALINPDGTLGNWTATVGLPGTVNSAQAVVTSNRVYLLGGTVNGVSSSNVYTAPVNPDGTIGVWVTGTSLPAPICDSQAVVTNSRVYLLGGNPGGGGVNKVYTAPVNPDGTIGAWVAGTDLPAIVYHSQVIITNNRVHLLGGNNGTGSSAIYSATITGGLNNYSPYYNETYVLPSLPTFTLPNIASALQEATPYIKY